MPLIISGKLLHLQYGPLETFGTYTEKALGEIKENWLLKYFNYDGENCLTLLFPNSIS